MKKIFIVAFMAFFAACNNSGDTKVDSMKSGDTTATTMRDINSPYPVGYSSKFEIADPKYAETILTLWKDWDNGNLSAHKGMFADSVTMHFWDGSVDHSSLDSAMAHTQAYRNTLARSVGSVDAVMSVKSTDKKENWALVWGKEVDTDKKGKVDSFYLQETWGFDSAGKVNRLYQFRAAAAPPKSK